MTLLSEVHRLLELGADPEALETTLYAFFEDHRGRLHTDPRCRVGLLRRRKERTFANIVKRTPGSLCDCVEYPPNAAGRDKTRSVLQAGRALKRLQGLLEGAEESPGWEDLPEVVSDLESSLESCGDRNVAALLPGGQATLDRAAERRGELVKEAASDECRPHLERMVSNRESRRRVTGEMLLACSEADLGMRASAFTPEVRLALEVWRVPHQRWAVRCAGAAGVLVEQRLTFARGIVQHAALEEGDTERVVDTALSLWDPFPYAPGEAGGPLSRLEGALEAARAVHTQSVLP